MTETTNFNFKLIDFDSIPWHTDNHNNWHLVDALLARYLAVSNVQGVWINALAVTVGQRFIDNADDTIWEVLVAHTAPSTGTFASARAATSTNWQSISVDASFKGTWAADTLYNVNDFISDAGRYGVVVTVHTSATSYDTGVTAGNIVTLFDVTTAIAATHSTNTVSVGGTPTATYTAATGVFDFGLVTGATGATGSTGVSGASNIVLDTSPQLGGDLDINSKFINGDLISDTDSTDSFGSTGVRWLKGWFDTLAAGTLTIGAGSITDSSGAIDFGNENLTTTGNIELGHASDTTLSRSASGTLAVEGSNVITTSSLTGKALVFGF
jgi:hypothetical protein|tara:strand:- start:915 stop:1892 length:978 start_codon:yes stop_codon:yes gene_type:complete